MDRDRVEPQVSGLPGERTQETVATHHAHAAPSTYVYPFVWDYSAPAIGPFCTDPDGNVLMDFTGHVGAMPLGYNNPKILDPLAEFDLVDPIKIAGQDFYLDSGDADLPTPSDLMARLAEVSSHYDMDTVFLSNSGAEAVENALKISFDHTRGKYGITFVGGFHGRTLATLSLNRSRGIYREAFPEISSVHDVPFCDDRTCDRNACECGFFPDGDSRLERMLGEGGYVTPEEVAFLVLEPIQGEGGYRFPSDAFAAEIARVQEAYDLHVIVDEVQTGLGRSGEFWASDHYPYEPDVIASAKGLRVGATVANEEIFPERTKRLSSTWGAGDLLSAAQGTLTIDAIHEHDLMGNATRRGRHFREAMADRSTPDVVEVRGLGLLLAVEFDTQQHRDAVIEAAVSRGLLTLGCGEKTIRILPPLDVTEREIDLGVDLLVEAIEAAN